MGGCRPWSLASAAGARGPLVVVDYAHTPDALARALTALRPVANARSGRLVCLFGCGGDRDPGKRPVMGGIAAELADSVVVSSDNPRHEVPEDIVRQIMAGVPASADAVEQVDRARAIMQTVWACAPEDVLLLAGKGHETYQDSGGEKLPFDDREWALGAAAAGRDGLHRYPSHRCRRTFVALAARGSTPTIIWTRPRRAAPAPRWWRIPSRA